MRKEPKPEDIALGQRIKWVREQQRLKPAEFARPLDVTRQAVVNWERGHGADRKRLERIALVYGVSFDWLATNRGEPVLGAMQHPSPLPVVIESPAEQKPARDEPLRASDVDEPIVGIRAIESTLNRVVGLKQKNVHQLLSEISDMLAANADESKQNTLRGRSEPASPHHAKAPS
ncbi:helix-turn-helix transcriptional regulator [Hoeflea sp. 108]|uniref:helix-turn-helix domain-containing protein n=1 Tax=Hoeflea sp. 108 TaxID=1116369 RepID=UPI0009D94CBB|nr:helix-turn-helix transcriptional regulator [Hoeflea sp. 108]